ncbi:MAG: LON peptidase substrate-binding domain-containing protein, partial [Deltaproteobacteria bacterium]|nr:LON peptidase substrate-binding domain-containing protein [Deltaproteobacteria bacterium]
MIQIPKLFNPENDEIPKTVYPLLPLRDIVVFPHMVAPLFVGRKRSVNALTDAMNNDKTVFLATQTTAGIDNPKEGDISRVGTIGTILQLLKLPDGTVKALVEGKTRALISEFLEKDDFFRVEVESVVEEQLPEAAAVALRRAVVDSFEGYAKINKNISRELVSNVATIDDASQLADTVAAQFSFKIEDKQTLLEAINLEERMSFLLSLVKMEIDIYKMDQRIRGRVKDQMEKTQKNYYLNEQMRAIKKEMGSEDEAMDDLLELEKRIEGKKMSEEAEEKA